MSERAIQHERDHPGRFLVGAVLVLVLPHCMASRLRPWLELWIWGEEVTR